jgi:hypothetical protein
MLLVARVIQRRIVTWFANNELESCGRGLIWIIITKLTCSDHENPRSRDIDQTDVDNTLR